MYDDEDLREKFRFTKLIENNNNNCLNKFSGL